jgi:OmpA family
MAYLRMGWPAPAHGGIGETYPPHPTRLLGFVGESGAPLEAIGGFALDSWTVTPAGNTKLIALARRIIAQGPRVLQLVGHTDRTGTAAHNQGLGKRRAEEVRRLLIATLDRIRPGSSRGMQIAVSSAGASQASRTGQNPPDRRVEIFGPPTPSVPRPPEPVPPVPPPPQRQPVPLPQAVSRSVSIVAARPMPAEQKRRLGCMLAMIQRPGVDDRYLNGFDYVFRSVTRPLSPEQLDILLNSHRVKRDLANPLFGPGSSDEQVAAELDRLDLRVLQGIAFLRRHRETMGAAIDAGKLQLNDWVARQQRNPNSIYSCWT